MVEPKSPRQSKLRAIVCPQCKRLVYTALATVTEYIDINFHCKCGYNKPLKWRRNELGN